MVININHINRQMLAVLTSIVLGCGSSSSVSTEDTSLDSNPENNHERIIEVVEETEVLDEFQTEDAMNSVYPLINEQYFDISMDYPIKIQGNVVVISETDGFVYLLTTYKMDIVDVVRQFLDADAVPMGDARLTVNGIDAELVCSNQELGYSLFRAPSGQGIDFHGLIIGNSDSLRDRDKLVTFGYIAVLGPFLEEGYFLDRRYVSLDLSRDMERRNRFAYRSTDFFVGAPLFSEDIDGSIYLIGLAEGQERDTSNDFNVGININSIISDIQIQCLDLSLIQDNPISYIDF